MSNETVARYPFCLTVHIKNGTPLYLDRAIHLNGDWEMCLSQLYLPRSKITVFNDCKIEFRYDLLPKQSPKTEKDFLNAQYMCKICARLWLFLQCTIYVQDCTSFSNAQDLHKIVVTSPMRNICTRFAQDLHKIVLLSPMCNICARFAQDCSYFSNAQYMHKICARLYLTSNLKW